MPAGRPLKFQSVEELDTRIGEYFNTTPEEEWTWTGLALWLDVDKHTLTNYTDRPEFSTSVKRAMSRVENSYEKDLKKSGRTGTIFALKNFDWKDKQEQEHYGKDGEALFPKPIMDVRKDNSDAEDTFVKE